MGPFNVTNRSYKYIIIMTDLFTRWTVILPLHDTSAAEIAKAIINVFFLYGPPQKMPIDQGKELVYQVSIYMAGKKKLAPTENDIPNICNCNIMQRFPGFYSLDKEHSKMISWQS